MARVKKGVNAHKRHKKIIKLAKGYYGRRKNTFKAANPAVMRGLRSAYVGRKNKKREYRRLWIARINAAGAQNEEIDELCMSCGDTPEKRREGK